MWSRYKTLKDVFFGGPMRHRLLTFPVILLVVLPVCAAQHEETLTIFHREGRIEHRGRDGSLLETATLDPANGLTIEIRPGDRLRIAVADPNPLVFSYKLEKGQPINTADFGEASKFADALKPVLDLLKAFTSKTNEAAVTTTLAPDATDLEKTLFANGITPDFIKQYTNNVADLTTHAKDIPALTQQSLLSRAEAQSARSKVADWKFDALKQSLKTELQTIDNASILLLQSLQGSSGRSGRVVLVASLNRDLLSEVLQNSGTPIGTPATTPPRVSPQPQPTVSTAPIALPKGELEREWMLAKNSEAYVVQLLATVDTFAEKAGRLDQQVQLGMVEFNAQQDQPVTVTIAQDTKDAKTSLVTGAIKLTLSPYSLFALKYDAGIVYSFVEARHYGTKADSSGTLKIVRTDSGDSVNGATGVAILSFVPRNLVDAPVGYAWQLGVSPVKDKIGLYAGAGVRVFKLISLGGGFTLQQAQRLANGLVETQSVTSADQLKTNNVFKPGGYVTVTVDLGGKK